MQVVEERPSHAFSTQLSPTTDTSAASIVASIRGNADMASLVSNLPIPSELDDEVDDAYLPAGHIWGYPCKLPSCPGYGKSWRLRSNIHLHLQEQEAHETSATTPAARRAIEIRWRYIANPDLPPRAAPRFRSREEPDEQIWDYSFKDNNGNVITGTGTMKQMEMRRALQCLQAEGTPDA